MNIFKASDAILNQIKKFEGFSSTPYKDLKTGKMAIGFGNTDDPITGNVSVEGADRSLKDRVGIAERELSTAIKKPLTQHQQDALIDMHYNAGLGGMKQIIDRINNGASDQDISNALSLYTKSTDVETGEQFEVPALVERASYRSQLWNKVPTYLASNQSVQDAPEDVDLLKGMEPIGQELQDQKYDMLQGMDIDRSTAPLDPKKQLDAMADSIGESSAAEVLRIKEAQRISEQLNIPYEDAYNELYLYSKKEIVARNAHAMTAKYFPAVAKWGQKDDANYVLMQDTEQYPHKVEAHANFIKPDDENNFTKALKSNITQVKEAYVYGQWALGIMDNDTAIKYLQELDVERQGLQSTGETGRIKERSAKRSKSIAKSIEGIANALLPEEGATPETNLETLSKVYDGSAEAFDAFISNVWDFAKHPGATANIITESAGSTLAPTALVLAGAGAGVPGLVVGTTSAAALGGMFAYGSRMQENLEEFRDKSTGAIDFNKAFSDPKKLSQWKKEATTYGVVMGASDALYGLIGGKLFTKIAAKGAKTPIGNAVTKITGVVAEAAVKGTEEAASEFTATVAADAVGGDVTAEKIGKAVAKSAEEGVFGAVTGAIAGPVFSKIQTKRQASKVMKTDVENSNKANTQAAKLSEVRAATNSNEALVENKEQVKTLIDEALTPEATGQELQTNIENTLEVDEKEVDAEIIPFRQSAEKGMVEISPSEWDRLHIEAGLDPLAEINKLTPEIAQAYVANKATDSSIKIPISVWATFTPEELDPGMDAAARVNGFEYNAIEGTEKVNELQNEPFALMNILPPDLPGDVVVEPPPLPEAITQAATPPSDVGTLPEQAIQVIEPESAEGNLISRPIELLVKGKTESEQKLYNRMLSVLKQATKNSKDIDPNAIDVVADFQLRHMRHRANILGVSVDELLEKLKFGIISDKEAQKRGYVVGGHHIPMQVSLESVAKIAFSKYANLPTVVHELGHSWLQEMAEDYQFIQNIPEEKMTAIQLEYKHAMDIAAELFGINNIGEMLELYETSRPKYERIHETFAQTTEKYFAEGKFANSKIAHLMEMFKRWMKPFLHTIGKAYPHYPPLNITPKVERIFDAILGASETTEDAILPMFPEPFFDPKMLAQDGAKYYKDYTEALSEATAETYTNIFNKNINERERLIDKAHKELFARATNDVNQMNSMKMLGYFEGQYDEFKKGEIKNDPRISFESFVKEFFGGNVQEAEEFKKLLPPSMISGKKKGGIDVKQFMLINGINDPNLMYDMLNEVSKRDELIDIRFNELVEKEMPVLKSENEIHQIAVDKINSDGKQKLLLTELKILANRYLPAMKGLAEKAINPASYIASASKEALTEKGQKQILDTSLTQFNVNKVLRDSERNGREAAKAFKSGDIDRTFNHKYLQAQNFFAYKFAKTAERYIVKTKQQIRKLETFAATPEAARQYDLELIGFAKQLVAHLKEGLALPHLSQDMMSEQSPLSPADIDKINDYVDTFNRSVGKYKGENIKVESFLDFGVLLAQVVKISRATREVEIQGKKYLAANIAQTTAAQINEAGGNVVDYLNVTPTSKIRVAKTNVASLMKSLFKTDQDYLKSPLGVLEYEIENAEAKRNEQFGDAEAKIEEALKAKIKKDPFLKSIYAPVLRRGMAMIGKSWDKPIAAEEINFSFKNKMELDVAMLTAMGSESGMQKFMRGNVGAMPDIDTGVIDSAPFYKMVKRMINDGTLTKEDFDFYQVVWDEFEKVHPMVKKAMRDVDGYEIGKIEASPFSNTFGQYKGGYFPVAPSKDYNSPAQLSNKLAVNKENFNLDAHDMYPSRKIGLTKERTGAVYPIDLDLRNVSRYLSTALNIAYLRAPLSSYEKVLKHTSLFYTLEKRRPGAINNVIVPHFERVKNQVYTEYSRDLKDTVSRYLRNNVNQVLYLFNIKNGLKQFLGTGQAAAKLGAGRVATALVETNTSPKRTREFIAEKSPMMRERLQKSVKMSARSFEELNTNFDWINWTKEKGDKLTFFISQTAQNIVDVATWRAAYVKGLDDGMSEAQSVRYADDIVKVTQTSAAVSNMANIQSGRDTAKLLTQVLSVPIAESQMLGIEGQRDQATSAKLGAIAKIAILAIVLPTIIEVTLEDALDDEEDEDKKRKKAYDSLTSRLSSGGFDMFMPMLSRPISGNLGPVFNTLGTTPRSKMAVKRKASGVDMSTKEFTHLMNHLTLFTGQGIFTAVGRGNLYLDALKTDEERMRELRKRRFELRELRQKEKRE